MNVDPRSEVLPNTNGAGGYFPRSEGGGFAAPAFMALSRL